MKLLNILSIVVGLWVCNFAYGKAVYVSSSCGSEDNNGSIDYPFLDVRTAIDNADTIFLKAGDSFYGGIVLRNKYMSRYGEGRNPRFLGWKRIIHPHWESKGRNIWAISLAEDNYSGVTKKGSSILNNVGCVHEYDKDIIHGYKVQFKRELREDWDFWQSERYDTNINPAEFDSLYLYLSINPNDLFLEFSTAETAIGMENATIDGIDFLGFGFGAAAKRHTTIRNCVIDIIGGKVQIGAGSWACFGNGIEFWVSRDIDDCLVENCIISRCYDCAVTIQGPSKGTATPRNIIIRNNLIKNCCQGWEDFLNNDPTVVYENCVFEKNTVLNSGEIGFGYPDNRVKYCHVLGNNQTRINGMIIKDNLFVGGNFYCSGSFKGEYKTNVWLNNICYIKRGDYILSSYYGKKDVIRIPLDRGNFNSISAATKDAIKRYRTLTGDETTKFIILSENVIRKKTDKLSRKFMRRWPNNR